MPDFRGNWIYFGEDFLDLCRWEKRLGASRRLSYAQWIPQSFNALRETFIQWTSNLGKPYGNSLDWWITRLAGRNTLQTPIFLHICYLHILHERLLQEIQDDCLIVCEDRFLLRAIEENLKRAGYHTRRSRFLPLRNALSGFADMLRMLARWIYVGSYQLIVLLVVKALIRSKGLQPVLERKLVIIHTCVDEACFGLDGKFHDRYFAGLAEWLEKNGYQVKTIPWLFNIRRSVFSAYSWIKHSAEQFLIPEQYLRLGDFVSSARQLLKSALVLQGKQSFIGYDVTSLIRRERRANLSSAGTLRFLLYIPFFRRWVQAGNRCDVFIDMFENMSCERPLLHAIKRYSPETLTVGYQHASIPKELMGYAVTADEWASGVFPDRIVTNGAASKEMLESSGFPGDALAVGPALRYRYLFDWASISHAASPIKNAERVLTVLLPLDVSAAAELLLNVVRLADAVGAAGMRVELKIHPMLPEELLLRTAGMSHLPLGWNWAKGSMYDQLAKTSVAVGLGTAALLDAAAAGVPVICLGRELGFAFNPLEYLADKYANCRAVSPSELPKRFAEAIDDGCKEYRLGLERLSSEIIHGLGGLNDENYLSFVAK